MRLMLLLASTGALSFICYLVVIIFVEMTALVNLGCHLLLGYHTIILSSPYRSHFIASYHLQNSIQDSPSLTLSPFFFSSLPLLSLHFFFFFGIRSLLSLTQTHTLINTNQKQKNMGTAYTQNYSNVAPPKMNQNMNGTCIPRGMGIR